MKLYIVTIYGHKFYFAGEMTAQITEAAEHFCIQLESNIKNSNPQKLFLLLLKHIQSDWNCPVTPVNIEHIFRINF